MECVCRASLARGLARRQFLTPANLTSSSPAFFLRAVHNSTQSTPKPKMSKFMPQDPRFASDLVFNDQATEPPKSKMLATELRLRREKLRQEKYEQDKLKREAEALEKRRNSPFSSRTRTGDTRKKPEWMLHKEAMAKKFPTGWNPLKRLSPDAMQGIRTLNSQYPTIYTTATLSQKFEVSPEAIRRILRSHWTPTPKEEQKQRERWFARGLQVWNRLADQGVRTPRKWVRAGVVPRRTYNDGMRGGLEGGPGMVITDRPSFAVSRGFGARKSQYQVAGKRPLTNRERRLAGSGRFLERRKRAEPSLAVKVRGNLL